MYRIIIYAIALLLSGSCSSPIKKDNRHYIAGLFKQYQLDSIPKNIEILDSKLAKDVFRQEFLYLKKGINNKIELTPDKYHKTDYVDFIVYHNHLGDYYKRRLARNDTLAFENYLKALSVAEKNKDTVFINETIRRINKHFLDEDTYSDIKLYENYVNELSKYKKDPIDLFWQKYYELVYDMTYLYDISDTIHTEKDISDLEERYLALINYAPDHPYFKGCLYQMTGIFYTYSASKDNKKAQKYFKKAVTSYNDLAYYSRNRKSRSLVGIAVTNSEDNNHEEAIGLLKTLLNDSFLKGDLELKKSIYVLLRNFYAQIEDIVNSNHYNKLSEQVENKLEIQKAAQINSDLAMKYKMEKKDRLITKLKKWMAILAPFIAIFALATLIFFFFYIRYKKRNKILEVEKSESYRELKRLEIEKSEIHKKLGELEAEKSETYHKLGGLNVEKKELLERLDKLKKEIEKLRKSPVEVYISVKDGKKIKNIYLNEVVYIRSNGHYLDIVKKDSIDSCYVRTRLKDIEKKLPSNFKRCHRSYIVNVNFIKQITTNSIMLLNKELIPLSRTYKDKFK